MLLRLKLEFLLVVGGGANQYSCQTQLLLSWVEVVLGLCCGWGFDNKKYMLPQSTNFIQLSTHYITSRMLHALCWLLNSILATNTPAFLLLLQNCRVKHALSLTICTRRKFVCPDSRFDPTNLESNLTIYSTWPLWLVISSIEVSCYDSN